MRKALADGPDFEARLVAHIHDRGPFIVEQSCPTPTRRDIHDSTEAAKAIIACPPGTMIFDRARCILAHGSLAGPVLCTQVP